MQGLENFVWTILDDYCPEPFPARLFQEALMAIGEKHMLSDPNALEDFIWTITHISQMLSVASLNL